MKQLLLDNQKNIVLTITSAKKNLQSLTHSFQKLWVPLKLYRKKTFNKFLNKHLC